MECILQHEWHNFGEIGPRTSTDETRMMGGIEGDKMLRGAAKIVSWGCGDN